MDDDVKYLAKNKARIKSILKKIKSKTLLKPEGHYIIYGIESFFNRDRNKLKSIREVKVIRKLAEWGAIEIESHEDFKDGNIRQYTLRIKQPKFDGVLKNIGMQEMHSDPEKGIVGLSPTENSVYKLVRNRLLDHLDLWDLVWKDSKRLSSSNKEKAEQATKLIGNGRSFVNKRLATILLETYKSFRRKFLEKTKKIVPSEHEKIKNNLPPVRY